MAVAFDGTATVYAGSGTSVSTGTLTTALLNNAILVAITINPISGSTITGVAGTGISTMQLLARSATSGNRIEVWWGDAAATLSTTITATISGSGASFLTIHAVAVNSTGNFLLSTPYFTDPVGGMFTGLSGAISVSTTNADDVVMGWFRTTTGNPTAGTGMTRLLGDTGSGFTLTEYKFVTTTQSGLSVAAGGTNNGGVAGGIVARRPPVMLCVNQSVNRAGTY